MTQEDKDLLLKDLCARLPYGLKVYYNNGQLTGNSVIEDLYRVTNKFRAEVAVIEDEYGLCGMSLDNVKPYLFPMSSMTDDQLYKLKEITDFRHNHNTLELVEWTETHTTLEFWLEEVPQYKVIEVFDWLNKNHFDYRGLIEKGLAIDATGKNIYLMKE